MSSVWPARARDLSEDELAKRASSREPADRGRAAAHPRLAHDDVARLARDPSPGVRARVAARTWDEPPGELASDRHPAVRRALARSTRSPETLARLLRDEDETVLARACENPLLPADAATAIAALGTSTLARRALARNPHAPAEALALCLTAAEPGVRQAAAENDATPQDLLLLLRMATRDPWLGCASSYQTRAMRYTLDEQRRLLELGPFAHELLADGRDLDPGTCEAIHRRARGADRHGETVRRSLAGNARTPAAILETLARDGAWEVRAAVAGNPSTPAATTIALLKDDVYDVRARAAESPSLDAAVVLRLLDDRRPEIHAAALRHAALPDALFQERVLKDESAVLTAIPKARRTIDRALWERIAARGWAPHLVAWSAPTDVTASLVGSVDRKVRYPLGLRGDAETCRWTVRDPDEEVRCATAGNANAPPDVLVKLAADPSLVVRRAAAKHPALPVAILSRLAQTDPEASVRASAATSPNVTEEVLELLAMDEDPYTVGNVACSPLATDALRERLRVHPNAWVRSQVAASRVATSEDHEALSCDAAPQVLEAVARAAAPTEVLRRLAGSRVRSVRALVATNARLPQEELEILARDQDRVVRTSAIGAVARRAAAAREASWKG